MHTSLGLLFKNLEIIDQVVKAFRLLFSYLLWFSLWFY